MVGGIDGEVEDILYGDVECYVYKQNGGGEVLLVNNDSYNTMTCEYYSQKNNA